MKTFNNKNIILTKLINLLKIMSCSSVFCRMAGLWQPNSPSLLIHGSSLEGSTPFLLQQIVNHTYTLYIYTILSSNYYFKHCSFLSHTPKDILMLSFLSNQCVPYFSISIFPENIHVLINAIQCTIQDMRQRIHPSKWQVRRKPK